MNNKNTTLDNMNDKLLMVEHPERGIWYFTSVNRAAVWIKVEPIHLHYCLKRKKKQCYKDYTFEWVDGSNVMYKYINPEK